jgi:hypothetical protein
MKHSEEHQPGFVRRLFRRIGSVIAEYNYAQRRMTEIVTAADRYLPEPDVAPEDYAEFLFRTSGLLRHEPPARKRIASR